MIALARVFVSLTAVSAFSVPGVGAVPEVATTDLEVDTSDRMAVLAFWNRYYRASEGARDVMEWDGNYETCSPGSASAEFVAKVERRINFYRALAGVGTATVTNTGSRVVIREADRFKPAAEVTKQAAAQRAALMFSWADSVERNTTLIHDPPQEAPFYCWSPSAWNAAQRGNLAAGLMGPEAIDGYMRENDPERLTVWSENVGHRRWLLKQGATDFATGDVPGDGSQLRPVNVLYVVPAAEEVSETEPRFAAWPSEGYFPDELMASQWSLSHPLADFSEARVTVIDGSGREVETQIVDRASPGYGDPSIVWSVPSGVAGTSVDRDTRYEVLVEGVRIRDEVVSHAYAVTVFDPDDLGAPQSLVGTPHPPETGASYFFDRIGVAEERRFVVSRAQPAGWTEGAEDGDSEFVIDGTSSVYELRASESYPTIPFHRSGEKAFRLSFPVAGDDTEQWFRIDRAIIPREDCELVYYVQRGFVSESTVMSVEISTDGSKWEEVDSLAGLPGNSFDDTAFARRSVAIGETSPFQLRFRLSNPSGGFFNTADSSPYAGVFIDDVSVSGADWISSSTTTSATEPVDHFRLDAGTAGEPLDPGDELILRIEAVVGGRDYQSGEAYDVTVGTTLDGYALWREAEFPLVTGGFDDDDDGDGLANGLEYAFGLDPLRASVLPRSLVADAGALSLRTPLDETRGDVIYRLEWSSDLSEWSATDTTVELIDGELVGEFDAPEGRGFVRWKVIGP